MWRPRDERGHPHPGSSTITANPQLAGSRPGTSVSSQIGCQSLLLVEAAQLGEPGQRAHPAGVRWVAASSKPLCTKVSRVWPSEFVELPRGDAVRSPQSTDILRPGSSVDDLGRRHAGLEAAHREAAADPRLDADRVAEPAADLLGVGRASRTPCPADASMRSSPRSSAEVKSHCAESSRPSRWSARLARPAHQNVWRTPRMLVLGHRLLRSRSGVCESVRMVDCRALLGWSSISTVVSSPSSSQSKRSVLSSTCSRR